MRLLTLIGLVALLSACDSAAPSAPDSLVGTWELADLTSETLVTSRIDQSFPNFSAQGEGRITVSGAVTADLRYVLYSIRQGGTDDVAFADAPSFPISGPITTLLVRREPSAVATLNVRANDRDDRFDDDGAVSIEYNGGRFQVVAPTLRASDGSGRQARAEGTLTFPLIALRAGQETTIETQQDEVVRRTLTFSDTGTFTLTSVSGPPLQGAWAAGPDGALELRYGSEPPDYSSQPRASYTVDGNALRISLSFPNGCTQECVPAYAASRYADPASLSAVRYVTTESYRRVSG